MRIFSAVLQWAMKNWRRDASLKGFDLGDGEPALLDLRFADDILLFAKSYVEAVSLLHDLVTALSQVGLILNATKTVVLTNEAQPPQHLQLPSGERIAILEHNSGQKWLGCILTAQSSKLHHVDVKHHLQQASKAFFRQPLDLDRPPNIDCNKAEILRQGGGYRGMFCCWTSGFV